MKTGALNTTREKIKKALKQALSPPFLLILLGSLLLWFTLKLSDEYTTEMPLNIRIAGQKYRLTAIVSGRGSALVAQRLGLKSRLDLTVDELSIGPSTEIEGAFNITEASLQQAINTKINDLVVSQIVYAPDFVPEFEPESTR